MQKLCVTEAGLIKGHLQFQNVLECVWQTEFRVQMASAPMVLPHFGGAMLSRQLCLPLRAVCASGVSEWGWVWARGSQVPSEARLSPFGGQA